MAGGPDLFVVCKNCQAEVSPYITECPYCGHRLRKRAPKIEPGSVPKAPRRARRAGARQQRPSLGRLRAHEMPGIRADTGRPYATMAIVLVSVILTLVWKATLIDVFDLVVGPDQDWYRLLTAPLVYVSTAYEVAALSVVFLFGWLLERRHGPLAPLLVFIAGGAAGMAVVMTVDEGVLANGANGAALALVGAWAVRDMLDRRRGEEVESDGLGVVVVTVFLVLLPVAVEEAHSLAGAVGGVTGLLLGFPLARMGER